MTSRDEVEYDSFLALALLPVGEFNANNRGDNVKGRLKGGLNFWRNTLNASDFVLSIIEYGYPRVSQKTQKLLKMCIVRISMHSTKLNPGVDKLLTKYSLSKYA